VPRALALLASFLVPAVAFADVLPERSPRIVSHQIDVTLDWPKKELHGTQVITWRNPTKTPVPDVWLHLYWNAMRDDESTFALESSAERPRARPEERGTMEIESIRVRGGAPLSLRFVHPDDDNDRDRTVVAADLPAPVPPGGELVLELRWHAKIPEGGVRAGWGPGMVFAAQWFPKPGVYEEGRGWNCHQYHSSTEFFADYGTYDVTIHAPRGWIVGASGRDVGSSGDVHHFVAEDVHDFAWAASDRLVKVAHVFRASKLRYPRERERLAKVLGRTPAEIALRDVQVSLLMPEELRDRATRYLSCIDSGLELFGLRYGRYPYDTLTVVVPPKAAEFACCMEYPTLLTTVGDLLAQGQSLEWVTMHEFGHQFFYGLVGSNEFETPWLDEGFTAYSTMRALETGFPPQTLDAEYLDVSVPRFEPWALPDEPDAALGSGLFAPFGVPKGGLLAFARDALPVASWPRVRLPEPRSEGAPLGSLARYREDPRRGEISMIGFRQYDHLAYRINSYSKTSVMLRSLERWLPPGTMDRILRTYSERHRFGHPTGSDFERVASEVSGRDLSWFFDQAIRSARVLDYAVGDVRPQKRSRRRYTDVYVRRLGEFAVPVEVAVRFTKGPSVVERWDGRGRFVRYRYDGARHVHAVEVDPRAVWWLDVDRGNNSWRSRPDRRPARRWSLRLLLWVEHAMRFSAGLS
jgi:hypothetical protein